MADSSTIGANFSSYTGEPNLAGGSLGVLKIDTKPLEDLARYTMLYNKAEYDQRQKDAEKAAEELAKFTAIDLSTTIPKDAKILQEKYDKVIDFIKNNPDAVSYKNRDKWLQYNKMKADLQNDTKFAAIRSLLNVSRQEQIANETDEGVKNFLKKQLQENIDATDIRTPLDHAPKYDLTIPDFGKNTGIKVDVTKAGSNQIFQRDFNLFDVAEANRAGAAAELGFSNIDPSTTTGQLKMIKADQNMWVKSSLLLNQAINNARKEDGTIDESKIAGLPVLNNIREYNKYVEQKRNEIAAGIYKDKLGNTITFGTGPFKVEDYVPINWQDGLSPSELAKVAQFSQWAGDEYQTKVIQTDDELQRQRLAVEWANYGIAKERINKATTQSILGADAILKEVSDAINQATPWTRTHGGKTEQVKQIADPNLLKEFATIDKEGNTVNRPDVIFFDPKQNQLSIAYYKKQDKDTPEAEKTIDGYVRNNKGEIIVEREVPVNPTEWFGQIASRKFSADDKGAINNFVDQIYDKFGRDLSKLATGYKGGATAQGPETKTTESAQTIKPVVTTKKTKKGLPVFE